MDGDRIAFSQEQLRRWHLLKMVLDKRICLKEAGERMGVSYRQAKRMKGRVARDGPRGLLHGNQGRKPANALVESQREKILGPSRTQYPSFNDTHFWQQLATAEGIRVSRETVRQLRSKNGIAPKRRRAQHRARRLRKPQQGMMVRWDRSPHPRFGPEQPPCCLMAAVDDATGKCLAARFFLFESSAGYLWLLRQMVRRYGIRLYIYQDQHSALKRSDDHWSLQEQLRGEQDPTQVGWALREPAIEPIYALSPQARGRIERLFATLQDRLLAEMQKADILQLEPAKEFLQDHNLEAFNSQFGRQASDPQKAWRSRPPGLDLDRICSLR
jgi:transposase